MQENLSGFLACCYVDMIYQLGTPGLGCDVLVLSCFGLASVIVVVTALLLHAMYRWALMWHMGLTTCGMSLCLCADMGQEFRKCFATRNALVLS